MARKNAPRGESDRRGEARVSRSVELTVRRTDQICRVDPARGGWPVLRPARRLCRGRGGRLRGRRGSAGAGVGLRREDRPVETVGVVVAVVSGIPQLLRASTRPGYTVSPRPSMTHASLGSARSPETAWINPSRISTVPLSMMAPLTVTTRACWMAYVEGVSAKSDIAALHNRIRMIVFLIQSSVGQVSDLPRTIYWVSSLQHALQGCGGGHR